MTSTLFLIVSFLLAMPGVACVMGFRSVRHTPGRESLTTALAFGIGIFFAAAFAAAITGSMLGLFGIELL